MYLAIKEQSKKKVPVIHQITSGNTSLLNFYKTNCTFFTTCRLHHENSQRMSSIWFSKHTRPTLRERRENGAVTYCSCEPDEEVGGTSAQGRTQPDWAHSSCSSPRPHPWGILTPLSLKSAVFEQEHDGNVAPSPRSCRSRPAWTLRSGTNLERQKNRGFRNERTSRSAGTLNGGPVFQAGGETLLYITDDYYFSAIN